MTLPTSAQWPVLGVMKPVLVTPLTIASWNTRLDEEGPDALVRLRKPVNTDPAFVACLVLRLQVLCPRMSRVRIARVLCRAGLHLVPTTVRRMLKRKPKPGSCGNTIPSVPATPVQDALAALSFSSSFAG